MKLRPRQVTNARRNIKSLRVGLLTLSLSFLVADILAENPAPSLHDFQARYCIELAGKEWTDDDAETVVRLMELVPVELRCPLKFNKPQFEAQSSTRSLLSAFKEPEQFFLARELLRRLLERYDLSHRVSKTSAWRQISGWKRNSLLILTADNQDPRGYALPSGMKNPSRDFVTTAMVYFLPPDSEVEDSIKCRTPEKFDFIKAQFASTPSPLDHPSVNCRELDTGLLDDLMFLDVKTGKEIKMGSINLKSVRGFEVMYATPGAGDISEIAGHLLLRIKLKNNPQADAMGIENPHDLVISCLADTEAGRFRRREREVVVQTDCQKQNWFNLVENNAGDEIALASIWQSIKGLSGGFLIIMDRQPLGEAIKSYTIEQDRDLIRYRLNLTEEMKSDLLDRLYVAKKNYKPKYYFFSKNCGSVLIKIIGQGIGDDEIANFDPMVSPPHTLIGNMIRKGLATRVYPTFYGYRKQGFIAKVIFKEEYNALTELNPEISWPPQSDFFNRKEFIRAVALEELGQIAVEQPALRPAVYRLATIAQESEMIHSYKDLICENYTSEATAEARLLQENILDLTDDIRGLKADTDQLIHDAYVPIEKFDYETGRQHTGHYSWGIGAGSYHSDIEDDGAVVTFEGALLQQEMGSSSAIAMQRGSAVEFGSVSAIAAADGIKEWRITGLSFRKFRDTLNRVESCLVSTRGLGLGLTALDFRQRRSDRKTDGIIAGFEVLGNIISSANHSDFLFISLGGDLKAFDYERHSNLGINVPIRAESLWTPDRERNWSWRNSVIYSQSTRDDNSSELNLSTSIDRPLGEMLKSEVLLRLALDYRREFAAGIIESDQATLIGKLEVRVNRW